MAHFVFEYNNYLEADSRFLNLILFQRPMHVISVLCLRTGISQIHLRTQL